MIDKTIINQEYIDNMFSCVDGYGTLDGIYEDCLFIQKTLKEKFDIFVSVSECQKFWKWRSNEWDGSFLSVFSKEEVIEWFEKYIKANDWNCFFEESGTNNDR